VIRKRLLEDTPAGSGLMVLRAALIDAPHRNAEVYFGFCQAGKFLSLNLSGHLVLRYPAILLHKNHKSLPAVTFNY